MEPKIRSWLGKNIEDMERMVIGATIVIPIILLLSGMFVVTSDNFFWMYSSFLQGFMTFLALFGTFIAFQLSELDRNHREWMKNARNITEGRGPINRVYNLVDVLKRMLESETDENKKGLYKSYLDASSYNKTLRAEVKKKTWHIFLMVSMLAILSMFGMFITDKSPFPTINVGILIACMTICSIILVHTIEFFRKVFFGKFEVQFV